MTDAMKPPVSPIEETPSSVVPIMQPQEGEDTPRKPAPSESAGKSTHPTKSLWARPMIHHDDGESVSSLGTFHTTSAPNAKDIKRNSVDSHASEKSESSTTMYSHESFEPFKLRVNELCHQLWSAPSSRQRLRNRLIRLLGLKGTHQSRSTDSVRFEFERLNGGYNRIILIDAVNKKSLDRKKYLLRIPRFNGGRPDRDVAILAYIRRYSSIPVAAVVKSDFTSDNPIGKPYVVQDRIPGLDLQNSNRPFPNLTHDQKKAFAKSFGQLQFEMLALRASSPGQIEPTSKRATKQDFLMRHFKVEGHPHGEDRQLDETSSSNAIPSYKNNLEFFQFQFNRWKMVAVDKTILKVEYMERLSAIAAQLDESGFLGDGQYCLCHLDLATAPRNILVDIGTDSSLTITAILNWDDAVFAPKFVACAPPMWIWAWSDDEDEDERRANDSPSTFQGQELKRLFEESVGQEYLHYAYQPQYRIARKLFEFALHGIHSSWKMDEANEMIDE